MRLVIATYVEVPDPTVDQIDSFLVKNKEFVKTIERDGRIRYSHPLIHRGLSVKLSEIPENYQSEYLFNEVAKLFEISHSLLYRQIMGQNIDQESFEKIIKCEQ